MKIKMKFSMTADLSKNVIFYLFSQFCIFGIQISEFLDFRYPDVHQDKMMFLILKGFQENQKNWNFRWPRPCHKLSFCCFNNFAYLPSKSVNFRISGILMPRYDDILHSKRLSKKSKELRFSMTADLSKMSLFAVFTILHIWDPNRWILGF